jgi:hypothetical protein
MTGFEYSRLIANYIKKNYSERGLKIYLEVLLGKTIIGKNRRIYPNEIKVRDFQFEGFENYR